MLSEIKVMLDQWSGESGVLLWEYIESNRVLVLRIEKSYTDYFYLLCKGCSQLQTPVAWRNFLEIETLEEGGYRVFDTKSSIEILCKSVGIVTELETLPKASFKPSKSP